MALSEAQRAARRKGGLARARQFTPESQAAARANVRPESLKRSGRRGYERCQEKHGPHFAARRLAAWRRPRPTKLEQTVRGWLDNGWVLYATECELVPGRAYADIVVFGADGRRYAIEADGRHFHDVNDHIGEDRPALDRERDALVRAAGYEVIRLSQAEIETEDGRAARARLSQAIGVTL
jgi:hypothetical protein